MDSLTLSAYAKINLTLAITGIREDGYHLLQSVMQEISLADTVILKKIPQGIYIECDRAGIPTDERNVCHKAAKRYLEGAGIDGGIHITLHKAIPDGAGMGGGSSDAAATLKGLSALYPTSLSLPEIAVKVGADVPFFLTGKTALCEGIGEIVTPLSFPAKERLFCVAVKDCDGLSTPQIYSLFDTMPQNRRGYPDAVTVRSALESGKAEMLFSVMENHLEVPAVCLRPEIAASKELLLSLGADAAMMTGSGSVVFGLFQNEKKAREAARICKERCREAHFCTLL